MRFFLPLLVFPLLLASCAPVRNVAALPDETAIVIFHPAATATFILPSPTSAPTQIPCDPRTVDFCITDGHLILQRPIQPPDNDSVDKSYRYGTTANGTRDPHHGVEFLNSSGIPVQSAGDGIVLFAGPDHEAIYTPWKDFYGNVIVIQHADDLYTLYAHLSEIDVQAGDVVQAGDEIGKVGSSGVATGSHLHFEVRRGNAENYFATQNPELWLIPERDERNLHYGVVAVSILDEANVYQFADFTIQRYSRSSDVPEKTYYMNTYVPELTMNEENAALSELPAGHYRIALKLNGYLYERWVDVQSGKLTQTIIIVK